MQQPIPQGSIDIGAAQIRLLFSQAVNVMYGSIITVVVEAMILWSATEHLWLLAWVTSFVVINVARLLFYLTYRRKQPSDNDQPRWLRAYLIMLFFVGLNWGASGFLIMVTPSSLHQTLIVITLGGVALIGISAYGSSVKAYLAFSLPVLIPLAIWQFSYGNTVHSGFGINILLFALVLFGAARNYNKAILASLYLRQENLELAAKADIANKAKSEFLANMSHEIRTPLTAILGYSETGLDDDQTPLERVFALRAIKRSSDHLLQIINDILDFSKIEANRLEAEHVAVNYFTMLSEIQALMANQVKSKGLDSRINYQFPLPAYLCNDPVRLKQILLNLCSNAIKFTEKGSVNISVRFVPDLQAVCFIVADTGIGMSAEQLNKIFTPFQQADSGTTRRFGGTGLGLSLSKRLVELLGGSISVKSTPGQGTTFTLSMPCSGSENVPFVNSLDDVDDQGEQTTQVLRRRLQGTVLLAEDNPENQKLLSMVLGKMGAGVITVENGKEALNKASDGAFDLIYMDMQMPLMSGIEATRRLRERGYNGPIIALTANATSEDRKSCLQAGCNDYLTKPVNRERLYMMTAHYLDTEAMHSEMPPILSQLQDDDPEIQSQILQFVQDLPPCIARLEQLQRQQAWYELRSFMNKLSTTGAKLGYPKLSALSQHIEIELEQNNLQAAAELLFELAGQLQQIYHGVFPPTSFQALRVIR